MAAPIFPAEFVVLSFDRPEGERFAIFRHAEWRPLSQWPSTTAEAIEEFVRSLELLTEESLRTQLQAMGIADDAATGFIKRARDIREMNKGGSWERVTDAGYRNDEGQEVVARTDRVGGDPGQRVYVMRCSVCGQEYGTYGVEIPHRCCPYCQDGPPGLPV